MIKTGLIKVMNSSNCWQETKDKLHLDIMADHLLYKVFGFIRKKGEYLIRSFMMCNEYFLIFALFHHFSFFSLFFVMKVS